MQHDSHKPMGDMYASESSLLEDLIKIQDRYLTTREDNWAHNLRFLRTPGVSLQAECHGCSGIDDTVTVLHLTEKHEYPDTRNYVCISYCWGSRSTHADNSNYQICSFGGIRANRAPSEILRRAIAYAISRNVPLIWIDQECIE
jgi:hypothetical protein